MQKNESFPHHHAVDANSRFTHLDTLRETVAKSWLRCQAKSVHPLKPISSPSSNSAALGMHATNSRPELFKYIFFHAERTQQDNDCSQLCIVITDAQGNVIRLLGDEEELLHLHQAGLSENTSLSEISAGSNGIGTCIYTRKPVYISHNEHYKEPLYPFITYGAPIFDERNEIVAVFGVVARRENPDLTWLNLVSQTASNISKECLIYHQRHDLQDLQTNIDRLINTINYGVVLLDEETRIAKANSVARYFFLMYEYELIGQPISTFISPQDIDFALLENDIYTQDIVIHSGEVKRFSFKASVYLTRTWDGKKNYLLVFDREQPPAETADAGNGAKWRFNDLVGSSPVFTEAIRFAQIASKTNCTVLLTGESGVGKKAVAEAIHNGSSSADGPFITVNCGAIPEGLIESELFGYESEGYPQEITPGKFEQANGGTIFLDKVGEMPLEMQMYLLRFFQDHKITRTGGKEPIKLNLRVIASTSKNLEDAIDNAAFRADLYYQLNTFSLHIPTLRERSTDIGNLAHYFLQKYKLRSHQVFIGFTQEALTALQNYSWPGNVRELESTIQRAVTVGRNERIRLDDLPENIRNCYRPAGMEDTPQPAPKPIPFSANPQQTEREIIIRALRNTHGNVTKAAELIGISRRTLYRKIEKYDIQN